MEKEVSVELYKMALPAPQLKEWYREKTRVSGGRTVKEEVDALYNQLNMIQGIWGRSPQSENDRIDYERDRENHQKAINNREVLAEKAAIEDALDGSIVALGFSGPDAVYPSVIPSAKWAYLELSFPDGKASGANQEYAGIRFMVRDRFDDAIGGASSDPDMPESKEDITGECGKRERQIQKIIRIAKDKGYDEMAIPENGKSEIKEECLKDCSLFTSSGFDHAWKTASSAGRLSIENKKKYLKE